MANTNLIELLKNETDNNEILRFMIPGIQAKDYKVDCLNFSNLLAFLVAKSINESLCCTLFDYEKIFDDCDTFFKLCANLQYYGKEKTDNQFDIAKSITIECIIKTLMDSYTHLRIPDDKLLHSNQMLQLVSDTVLYVINVYNNIAINALYPLLRNKQIVSLVNTPSCIDSTVCGLSGLSNSNPNKDNLADIEATIQRWFTVLFQHLIEALPGELFKILSPILTSNPVNPTNPNVGPGDPATAPAQNQQINIQMPVVNTDLNVNKSKIDLVGWQDLKPGIIATDGSDSAPVASGDTYESLNQEDRQIVDSLIQGMMHVSQMQQNPEAHQDEINAAREALHQELEGGAPQINIQPTTTEQHTCNCGNDHCTCGCHH